MVGGKNLKPGKRLIFKATDPRLHYSWGKQQDLPKDFAGTEKVASLRSNPVSVRSALIPLGEGRYKAYFRLKTAIHHPQGKVICQVRCLFVDPALGPQEICLAQGNLEKTTLGFVEVPLQFSVPRKLAWFGFQLRVLCEPPGTEFALDQIQLRRIK
jgi:hypothetical protein